MANVLAILILSVIVEVDPSVNFVQQANNSSNSSSHDVLEYGCSTPNTSLHFLFSPPTNVSAYNAGEIQEIDNRPPKSQAANAVTLISRTSRHLILRKRTGNLESDDVDSTPEAKRVCHR